MLLRPYVPFFWLHQWLLLFPNDVPYISTNMLNAPLYLLTISIVKTLLSFPFHEQKQEVDDVFQLVLVPLLVYQIYMTDTILVSNAVRLYRANYNMETLTGIKQTWLQQDKTIENVVGNLEGDVCTTLIHHPMLLF
jgi:hypothetical protein